jgi:hypothetical protein
VPRVRRKKNSKRARLRQRAEWKRSRLEDVSGLKPNPCEVTEPFTSVDACAETRSFDCPRYSDCLDVACIADWNGWTCVACPAFCLKKRWERIVRKVVTNEEAEKKIETDDSGDSV